MASHNQCTVCCNSFISKACVIYNVCCERLHLSCCDALNDLDLTDNLCCKRCSNNKPCSIPIDLRKNCESGHGISSVNMQAPSNQLTRRFMQHHLDIDGSNQENSSNFLSLNDVIDNVIINGKNYSKPSINYVANVSYHTSQSINLLLQPFDNKTKNFLFHFTCISLQKNVDKLRLHLDNLAYKSDTIMVSETKLKRDSLLINIEINE